MGAVLRVRNKKTNEMVDYVQEKMIQFAEVVRVTDSMKSYPVPVDATKSGKLEIMVQQSSNINNPSVIPSFAKMIKNVRRVGNNIVWDIDDLPCRLYPTLILGVS